MRNFPGWAESDGLHPGDKYTIAGVHAKPTWAKRHPWVWKAIGFISRRWQVRILKNQPLHVFEVVKNED